MAEAAPHYLEVLTPIQLERLRALAKEFDERRITWDQIPEGHERSWEKTVTQESVYAYADGVQDYSSWYVPGFSPFGSPVAPPLMVSRLCTGGTEDIGPLIGWIHGETRTKIVRPIFIGTALEFKSRVSRKYIKRGRKWIELTVQIYDKEKGDLVGEDVRTFCESYMADESLKEEG